MCVCDIATFSQLLVLLTFTYRLLCCMPLAWPFIFSSSPKTLSHSDLSALPQGGGEQLAPLCRKGRDLATVTQEVRTGTGTQVTQCPALPSGDTARCHFRVVHQMGFTFF